MKRNLIFVSSLILSLAVFSESIRQLIALSLGDGLYTYIPLIPFVSIFFLYRGRNEIFTHSEYNVVKGLLITLIGGAIGLTEIVGASRLPLLIFSAWVTWVGLFVFFYGFCAFKSAIFSFLFLLFMVPLPYSLVQKPLMHMLQDASTEIVGSLFYLVGAHAVRDGNIFHLPGLSIEVNENCGGIRSGISLLITSVIAAKLFLHKGWTRVLAVMSSVPLAILQNGVRIVTLALLGLYVDERFLDGGLHMDGGKAWFCVSLLIVWAVIALMRKIESRRIAKSVGQATPEKSSSKIAIDKGGTY